jgi:hypothetical protein
MVLRRYGRGNVLCGSGLLLCRWQMSNAEILFWIVVMMLVFGFIGFSINWLWKYFEG